MDELTLLRELDADAPPLAPGARHNARARLEREIARPLRPPGSGRSPNSRQVAWLLLALAFVGGLAVAIQDIRSGDETLTASDLVRSEPADDVLELAASGRERLALTPTPRRDQYLYTREITEADPIDPSGTARTFVEEEWHAIDEQALSRTCELGRCWTSPGNSPTIAEEPERIPREPRRLLLYARTRLDPSPPTGPFTKSDWLVTHEFLFGLLSTPLIVPPDLRAAVLRALAYTPNARVEHLEFRGRPAVIIETPSWAPGTVIDRYTSDIIIDRNTHEYLGSRWELGPADMKGRNGKLFNSSRVRLVSYLTDAAVVDRLGERP